MSEALREILPYLFVVAIVLGIAHMVIVQLNTKGQYFGSYTLKQGDEVMTLDGWVTLYNGSMYEITHDELEYITEWCSEDKRFHLVKWDNTIVQYRPIDVSNVKHLLTPKGGVFTQPNTI